MDNWQEISKNIVIVLIDTIATLNTISLFYPYLFDFIAIFYKHCSLLNVDTEM
jgi:hypothetical protein